MSCNGNCTSCSGCARELVLTRKEIDFLGQLGQIPFLPVARNMGDLNPVFPENPGEDFSLLLQCLEKKGLISISYDKALAGADMSAYKGYPVHGSMGLTQRGYSVLELLETQGIE